MLLLRLAAVLGLATTCVGRSLRHVGKDDLPNSRAAMKRAMLEMETHDQEKRSIRPEVKHHRRAGATIVPQNANTTRYAVDGTKLPYVNFDIGESYAGLMPTGETDKGNATRELYFWYFPLTNPNATDEITIWLNGGPGCSSLEGLLQENGPFLWQYGTYQPVPNPWSWNKLTNMLWVEQPVGTGFSQGTPRATNEIEVAQEFLGFFKRFSDTFGIKNRKVYITGESYAGYYVPYIASAMFANGDKTYYDVEGTMIYDPTTSTSVVHEQISLLPFVEANQNLFTFNHTFMKGLRERDQSCGYADFRSKYLTFPPKDVFPSLSSSLNCNLWSQVYSEATNINPCFDVYQVATTCPLLYDVLGFPGSFPYTPTGAPPIYFNQPAVQKVINAPIQSWSECSSDALPWDKSPPTAMSVLPGVIEKSKRTVIGSAMLDMVILANGTLLSIQNMTWGGKQGFQTAPKAPFRVPSNNFATEAATLGGFGKFGTFHTERGLTWSTVQLSGHMVPQYAPSAAFRQLEFLLGRIDSLNSKEPFSIS